MPMISSRKVFWNRSMILNTVCEKENFKMIRMKKNYYIKKYYGDFVLLKRAKNKENCKKVLEKVGVYGTLREVKEAIIKEMIKDEVNHRKTEPLYKLIPLIRQMYNRFYEENMECCFVG